MKQVKELSLQEILDDISLEIKEEDIEKFCRDRKLKEKLVYAIQNGEYLNSILFENQDKIDKENLLFISWLNYSSKIERLKGHMKEPEVRNNKLVMQSLKNNINDCQENMNLIKKITNEMDTYIVTAISDQSGQIIGFDILSSQEEIQQKRRDVLERRNKRLFKKINQEISPDDTENRGISYAIQCIELDDLYLVLPTEIAAALEYKVQINARKICKQELEKRKEKIEKEEYDQELIELENNLRENVALPEMQEGIEYLLKYIDLEKLLLISVYRFEEVAESQNEKRLSEKEVETIYNISKELLKHISKDTKIDEETIKYEYKDAEDFLKRFNYKTNTYIFKEEYETIKNELLNGKDITNIGVEELIKIDTISFSLEELEEIMKISSHNLLYGILKMKPTEEKMLEYAVKYKEIWGEDLTAYLIEEKKISDEFVLKLYYNDIINAEFLKEFSENHIIVSKIDLNEIHKLYKEIKDSDNEEKEIELNKNIELYKKMKLEGKTEEEIEDLSNDLMYELAENFDEEEDIIFYYANGMITLASLVDWSGEQIVDKLYKESTISLEDIIKLYDARKISQSVIERMILEKNEDYTSLITNMKNGYISEDTIIEMYMQGKIFDIDFKELEGNNIISTYKYKEATLARTQETLEKEANITIEPVLVNIPDKKIRLNIVEGEEPKYQERYGSAKPKTLIDPNARYEYLRLLGAKKANAIIPDEDNAFYNYEFYVIPNINGELDIDSVVIAERFYKNKDEQVEFSTDNATYFFKYKDLMVNSNLTKKEMTQARNNVVYTSNHRVGSWAISTLYKIAQTRASSDFKEYTGDKKRNIILDELYKMYTHEQIMEILDFSARIDDTNEFIYEEVLQDVFEKKNNKKGLSNKVPTDSLYDEER